MTDAAGQAYETRDGWSVVVSGEDGTELLSRYQSANGFSDALLRANVIGRLVDQYEQSEYTQITLRSWRVEVIVSAPTGAWRSVAQRDFAVAVDQLMR